MSLMDFVPPTIESVTDGSGRVLVTSVRWQALKDMIGGRFADIVDEVSMLLQGVYTRMLTAEAKATMQAAEVAVLKRENALHQKRIADLEAELLSLRSVELLEVAE